MRARIPRLAFSCWILIALAPWGAARAAAQADPMSPLENLKLRLGALESAIGPMRDLERDLRDGTLIAVVRGQRVDYVDRAALREGLRLHVTQTLAADSSRPDALVRMADDAYVKSVVAPLEEEAVRESNAVLDEVVRSRQWIETRIRQLREDLQRLEGEAGAPAGSPQAPGGSQGRWQPASQRVCPSPLFGELLWSGTTARCVGEDFTLWAGWRFDSKEALVCARCTPNCTFSETTGGRLICAVTGAPAGTTPAPGTPSPRPSPRRTANLAGSWQPAAGGPEVTVMTGGPSRYMVLGTGSGRVRNEGTLVGDGTNFEGAFKDVPGYCCGREGYVWLEVIDEQSYRARSVWWTPGRTSRERPDLTYGWTTWKRKQ